MTEIYHPEDVALTWAAIRREKETQKLPGISPVERLAQHTVTLVNRHPRITWGLGLALLAVGVALIPPYISASKEADRVLQEIAVSRALEGGTIIVPTHEAESTPIPGFEPQPPAPPLADYLRKAYLELVIPTEEGKSVVEIMSELGYVVHSFVHLPETPETLRADNIGNYLRRVPVNMEERAFVKRFMTMNVIGSVNAKEKFSNIATLAVVYPDQSVGFYAIDPKGWVNIADRDNNGVVKWSIQEQELTEELKKAIAGFKTSPQTVPGVKL